jgi:hypothetical protein
MTAPIHVAIKFPSRIRVEHTLNYRTVRHETSLNFHGSDGSRLTVILSDQQVHALMGIRATDPLQMARDLYVAGHIEVDEFERRMGACGLDGRA